MIGGISGDSRRPSCSRAKATGASRAYDSRNGKVLWTFNAGAGVKTRRPSSYAGRRQAIRRRCGRRQRPARLQAGQQYHRLHAGMIFDLVDGSTPFVGWAKPTGPAFGRPDDRLPACPPFTACKCGWARFALPTLQVLAILLAGSTRPPPQNRSRTRCRPARPCHGEKRHSARQSPWPVIWGQHQGYLYLQLRDFKSGNPQERRDGADRGEAGARRNARDRAFIFSQKAWPNLRQGPRASTRSRRRLRATNASVGCTGCHQARIPGRRKPSRVSPDRVRITS